MPTPAPQPAPTPTPAPAPQQNTQPLVAEIRQPVVVQMKSGIDWAALAYFFTGIVALSLGIYSNKSNSRQAQIQRKHNSIELAIELGSRILSDLEMENASIKSKNFRQIPDIKKANETYWQFHLLAIQSRNDHDELDDRYNNASEAVGKDDFADKLYELATWIKGWIRSAQNDIDKSS